MDVDGTAQVVIPAGFNATSAFDDAAKQRIKDAGDALTRGDEGAANLLIQAATPLTTIVTQQFTRGRNRAAVWDDFFGEANVGLVRAVRAVDERLRAGRNSKPPPQSYRAYLSTCILNHLRSLVRKPKAAVEVYPWCIYDWLDRAFATEYASEPHLQSHVQQLDDVQRRVFEARRSGTKWDEIGVTVNKSRRQAQRILEQAKHILIGGIVGDHLMKPTPAPRVRPGPATAIAGRGPTLPTRKTGVGLGTFRRLNS